MTQTDKLCLFVDDMRRMGVDCLPPDINASRPLHGQDGGVRYALGALKGVGEKAMEELVTERSCKAPFASLEDFAARIDPRILNRRQLESLASAGALDASSPIARRSCRRRKRSSPMPPARTRRRPAGRAACSAAEAMVRPKWCRSGCRATPDGRWPSAWRPSATPSVSISRRIRSTTTSICSPRTRCGSRPSSARSTFPPKGAAAATMAGLVEEARWRTSQKGRRFMMARFSDSGGQFDATVFDDEAAAAVEAAAKAGQCGLLTVELDRRPGRRTAAGHHQALPAARRTGAAKPGRTDGALPGRGSAPSGPGRVQDLPAGSGIVRLVVPVSDGRTAQLLLPGRFAVDAELGARLRTLRRRGRRYPGGGRATPPRRLTRKSPGIAAGALGTRSADGLKPSSCLPCSSGW